MTKLAIAVIGANYGDEGKGQLVDFWTNQRLNHSPIVIKNNGGSQAGHTVNTPDGKRHIFSHFGSGAFLNAPTYLSEYFIVNPTIFRCERNELNALRVYPETFIHPDCIITTPFDVALNHCQEKTLKHGSTGLGIYATKQRNEFLPFTIKDYVSNSNAENQQILKQICEYTINAIHPCNLRYLPVDLFNDDVVTAIIQNFMADMSFMHLYSTITNYNVLRKHETLIFENGQGLLLDERYGYAPHLTPSNTGSANIYDILHKIEFKDKLILNYITRSYITRHGNGPLADEAPMTLLFEDDTNKTNEWQGKLRYAPFTSTSMSQLLQLIRYDSLKPTNVKINYEVQTKLAVSHMDVVNLELDNNTYNNILNIIGLGKTRNDWHLL